MPPFESFRDAESYYAVLAHECTHWTRHPSRLDRDFGRKQWGDEGYAREELVAELGSAFIAADLELALEPRDDHTAYVGSWLKVHQGRQARDLQRRSAHTARRRLPARTAGRPRFGGRRLGGPFFSCMLVLTLQLEEYP